jgi:hypothetical protein
MTHSEENVVIFSSLSLTMRISKLECLSMEEQSSLFVSDDGKQLYVRNLRVFVMSLSVCPWQALTENLMAGLERPAWYKLSSLL